ncbi:hypothetical protein [Streptomyces synnematoformans]|uniref:Uncharacterized protein n=1 Tax=Streptomyces synnematoformans TaxID=415721 RepID=A0ABN2XBE0_9ACTN
MQTLSDLVHALLDGYAISDGHEPGPGLLRRLDDIALRTAQPHEPAGRTAPGSRPPTPLEAVFWSTRIKTEAVGLDRGLRNSAYAQHWEKALRAIPHNAEAADQAGHATSLVGTWVSTAETVLGLRSPSEEFRGVLCLVCDGGPDRQPTIYGRADGDRPRAWCVNIHCADEETGRPARYEGPRLVLLSENRIPQEDTAMTRDTPAPAAQLLRLLHQSETLAGGVGGVAHRLKQAGHPRAAELAADATEAVEQVVTQILKDLEDLENEARAAGTGR